MKYTVTDRIMLNSILPQEGAYEDLVIIKSIREKMQFSEKEIEKYKIKTLPNGHSSWDPGKDIFEFEFSSGQKALLRKQLVKMSEEKKLVENHVSLYEEFVK